MLEPGLEQELMFGPQGVDMGWDMMSQDVSDQILTRKVQAGSVGDTKWLQAGSVGDMKRFQAGSVRDMKRFQAGSEDVLAEFPEPVFSASYYQTSSQEVDPRSWWASAESYQPVPFAQQRKHQHPAAAGPRDDAWMEVALEERQAL